MRSLNKSSRSKLCWVNYQHDQLNQNEFPGLKPAFPGSMLCNHILVPAGYESQEAGFEFTLPDVSCVVYEYCDGNSRTSLLKNALVLDVDADLNHDVVASITAALLIDAGISRVVILGAQTYQSYGESIRSAINIEVQMFEPDWMSSSGMHSIYRQASGVLFINTMRVLDAVSTGCDAFLVADEKFRQVCAYPVLHRYLKSAGCEIYDETGKSLLNFELPWMVSHEVIDNNIHSVKKAVRRNITNDGSRNIEGLHNLEEDWFDELNLEASAPLIKPYCSSAAETLSGLRDRRTGFIRKLIKLGDDPKAFLLDSKFRLLRILGRAFSITRRISER